MGICTDGPRGILAGRTDTEFSKAAPATSQHSHADKPKLWGGMKASSEKPSFSPSFLLDVSVFSTHACKRLISRLKMSGRVRASCAGP